jgi:hypothetical protein
VPGAGRTANLKLHQPVCGKADHLAQQIGVGTLLQQRTKAHHRVGHRRLLGSLETVPTNPTGDPR